MPASDKSGVELKEGDKVTVAAVVHCVSPGATMVWLRLIDGDGELSTTVQVDAKSVTASVKKGGS